MIKPFFMYCSYQHQAEILMQTSICETLSKQHNCEFDKKFYDKIPSSIVLAHTSCSGFYDLLDTIEFIGGGTVVIAHDGVLNTIARQLLKKVLERFGGKLISVLGQCRETSDAATIYSRIAGTPQTPNDDRLASQELRCRQYAYSKGWKVVGAFRDLCASGNSMDRLGLMQLFMFLEGRKDKTKVVIDDPSRLARDLAVHIKLREMITERGGELITVTQDHSEHDQ